MSAASAIQIIVFLLAASLSVYVFQQLRSGVMFSYEHRGYLRRLRLLVLGILLVLGLLLFDHVLFPQSFLHLSQYFLICLILLYAVAMMLSVRALQLNRLTHIEQERHRRDHDKTTGLPNRVAAYRYLEAQLQQADSGRHPVLMVLLLSGIAFVDDRYGLGTAELVIREVCRRVHVNLRRTDFVARVSEHALLVFVSDLQRPDAIRTVAEHIVEEVKKPIELSQYTPSISPHIGVLQTFDKYRESSVLVRRAQLLAVEAQTRGMSVLFESDVGDYSRLSQIDVLEDWHHALTMGNLDLYYQPQVELRSGDIIGAEALLRFPTQRAFSLDNKDFSTLLSQSGLTHELNVFVFKRLLSQLHDWKDKGINVPIGFNVSIKSFQNRQFVNLLSDSFERDPDLARRMKIEITESESVDSMTEVIRSMQKLVHLGVQFSIDDFGTRYASMEYMQQLPIHEVKIDKSFVLNALNDQASADIVRASIELAGKLGLKVIAEGVENEEIKDWLVSMGCQYAQGYYFAAPMPATEFNLLLRKE